MKGLTLKQARVLAVVRERIQETGSSPTVREIGAEIGVDSSCTVYRHLEALIKKGYLTQPKPFAFRGLRLPDAGCCPTCQRPYGIPQKERAA